jgi:hypothetical protein
MTNRQEFKKPSEISVFFGLAHIVRIRFGKRHLAANGLSKTYLMLNHFGKVRALPSAPNFFKGRICGEPSLRGGLHVFTAFRIPFNDPAQELAGDVQEKASLRVKA